MRSTFNVLFFLKKNAKKQDGTAPIIARITVNGKNCQFNTKQYVKESEWHVKMNKVKGLASKAKQVNGVLEEIKTALRNTYNDLILQDTNVTAEKVKNAFLGIAQDKAFLIELFDDSNNILKRQVGISKSKTTYQKAEVCKRHLTNYIKDEYQLSDIDLREVNHSFIIGFESYLKTACKCNSNTAAKFIQKFRSIIIIAINNGQIRRDPFANYKIRLAKVDRGYLSKDELQNIIQKEIKNERLCKVRDIFVFSCYTGLAYIDIKNLTTKNISKGFDDKLWIKTKRQKTNVETVVPLLEIPHAILKRYKGLPKDVLLPIPSNQKTNAYLKEIADICGINKNLTFHLARHTFATTITLSNGVPIEFSVAKLFQLWLAFTIVAVLSMTTQFPGRESNIALEKVSI